jgi:hypothetical protein
MLAYVASSRPTQASSPCYCAQTVTALLTRDSAIRHTGTWPEAPSGTRALICQRPGYLGDRTAEQHFRGDVAEIDFDRRTIGRIQRPETCGEDLEDRSARRRVRIVVVGGVLIEDRPRFRRIASCGHEDLRAGASDGSLPASNLAPFARTEIAARPALTILPA